MNKFSAVLALAALMTLCFAVVKSDGDSHEQFVADVKKCCEGLSGQCKTDADALKAQHEQNEQSHADPTEEQKEKFKQFLATCCPGVTLPPHFQRSTTPKF